MIINFLVTGSQNPTVRAAAAELAQYIAGVYPDSLFVWLRDKGGAQNRPVIAFDSLFAKGGVINVKLALTLKNLSTWSGGALPFDLNNSDPEKGFAPLIGYTKKGKPMYSRPTVIANGKDFESEATKLEVIYDQLVAAEFIDSDDRLGKILSAEDGDKSFFLPNVICEEHGLAWFAVNTEAQAPTSEIGTRWYKIERYAIGGCMVTTGGGTSVVDQDAEVKAIFNKYVPASAPTPTAASAAAVDASPVQPAPAAAAPRGFV